MIYPYLVEIAETHHRSVVINAETEADAISEANSLCDDGTIDMERNCYAGRTVTADKMSHGEDLSGFERYDVNYIMFTEGDG